MKKIPISCRGLLRYAQIKFSKRKRWINNHRYLSIFIGLLIILFIVAANSPRPTASSTANATQAPRSGIAELDAARDRAATHGEKLPVINLTGEPPSILSQPTTSAPTE